MAAYELAGKSVLITGAARGIGAITAKRLATRGARLSLVGFEPEQLAAVAAECGNGSVWFEADVTDHGAIGRAVDGTVEALGGIDVAIANAGIATGGTTRTIDPGMFDRVIEVNLLGAWHTLRLCLPQLIERRGYALAVASVAAIAQPPMFGAYGASKAGIEAACNSLRLEVAHLGVDVGVGYFSWLDTDLVTGAQEKLDAFDLMRSKLPGPTKKTYPVEDAAKAIERGVEKRKKRIVAPGWVRTMIAVRGLVAPSLERSLDVKDVVDTAEREAAEKGAEAFRPTGAGGEADARAREHART